MKIILIILCILCVVIEPIVFINLKRTLKAHGEEPVEENIKGIMIRFGIMLAIPVVVAVLSAILYFVI